LIGNPERRQTENRRRRKENIKFMFKGGRMWIGFIWLGEKCQGAFK
jgi:hypothetical protein